MTVSSTLNRVSYAGNGVTTAFSFPYKFLAASDLVVSTIDGSGNIVSKILTTDYTVSGTQDGAGAYPNGGTVTMNVAPASGLTLVIVRAPDNKQASHWVDGDPDPSLTKETAFDKLTLMVQRALDLIGRSVVLPDAFAGSFSNQMPSVLTAGYALGINNTGNGWTLIPASGTNGTVTSISLGTPAEFAGSGPITTSGTLTFTKVSQSANQVWAGPTSGPSAQPTFRALVVADIPSGIVLTTLSSGAASNGQVPVANGSGGITWQNVVGTGTVTSVGLSAPAEFTVSGSPVSTTGTLTFAKANQSANTVWAGPTSGGGSPPTFRALVAADLPTLVGATNSVDGSAGIVPKPLAGQQGLFLRGDSTWAATPQGTVTSVAVSVPSELTISGTPITSSGTLAIGKANQSANQVWAGPSTGAAAAPSFRALVPADIPLMTGATGLSSGIAGAVPAPNSGEQFYFLRGDGTWSTVGAGTGTVQSVGLSMPGDFTVSNSPVTGIGTLTAAWANQSANLVHAGPASGVAAAPTWRALVVADIPSGIVATTLSSGAAGNGQVLTANGLGGATWTTPAPGGVTSVAMTVPGFLSVSGSPITTSGTLAVSLATQSANTVFAGPTSGGAVAPTFRSLVAADIPQLALTSMSSGVAGNGQVATANGSGGVTWTTLTASVSSVGLSDGSTTPIFSISGSPVTAAGTLTFTLKSQSQNLVFASPSGSAGQPGFRSLVVGDISSTGATNGQVPVANGSGGVTWGSAGGGGGSLEWLENTNAPSPLVESSGTPFRVYSFQSGLGQSLYAAVKVPSSYIVGNPIKLKTEFYSPDSSGTALIQTISTLIRQGTDAVSSTTNQRTSTNSAVTLGAGTVSIPQGLSLDLTDSTGKINSVAVSPGDLILVQLTRGTDTGASDLKVPVYGAEVTIT